MEIQRSRRSRLDVRNDKNILFKTLCNNFTIVKQLLKYIEKRDELSACDFIISRKYKPNSALSFLQPSGRRGSLVAHSKHIAGSTKISKAMELTPLMQAVLYDCEEVVKCLVLHGEQISVKNCWGATALHFAATKNLVNIGKILIEAGCDIDSQTDRGDTSCHLAVSFYHSEFVRLLVLAGCNVEIRGSKGKTVTEEAEGYPPIQRHLNHFFHSNKKVLQRTKSLRSSSGLTTTSSSVPASLERKSTAPITSPANSKSVCCIGRYYSLDSNRNFPLIPLETLDNETSKQPPMNLYTDNAKTSRTRQIALEESEIDCNFYSPDDAVTLKNTIGHSRSDIETQSSVPVYPVSYLNPRTNSNYLSLDSSKHWLIHDPLPLDVDSYEKEFHNKIINGSHYTTQYVPQHFTHSIESFHNCSLPQQKHTLTNASTRKMPRFSSSYTDLDILPDYSYSLPQEEYSHYNPLPPL